MSGSCTEHIIVANLKISIKLSLETLKATLIVAAGRPLSLRPGWGESNLVTCLLDEAPARGLEELGPGSTLVTSTSASSLAEEQQILRLVFSRTRSSSRVAENVWLTRLSFNLVNTSTTKVPTWALASWANSTLWVSRTSWVSMNALAKWQSGLLIDASWRVPWKYLAHFPVLLTVSVLLV